MTVLFVGALLFGAAAMIGFLLRQRCAALYRRKYDVEYEYRSLFESSRDALMTIEPPSWRFTAANPAMLAMFRLKNRGTSRPLNLGTSRRSTSRTDCASGEKAREMIETALREGFHFFEWTHKRMDGG